MKHIASYLKIEKKCFVKIFFISVRSRRDLFSSTITVGHVFFSIGRCWWFLFSFLNNPYKSDSNKKSDSNWYW